MAAKGSQPGVRSSGADPGYSKWRHPACVRPSQAACIEINLPELPVHQLTIFQARQWTMSESEADVILAFYTVLIQYMWA
jgi:hypothetical protein